MATSKKEVELWRLERFKSLIPDFPKGRIEAAEEPDFLIHGEDGVVGIELTDLHRVTLPGQVPQQASEAMRNRVVARAKEIFDSYSQQPVIATFHLNDRLHIKKDEVEKLAKELALLVARNIPLQNSISEISSEWDDSREAPNILHILSVRRFASITETFFSSPGATWISTISRTDIERVLSAKEQKHAAYLINCDTAWLIINLGIEKMTTWFEFDSAALAEPFLTKFSRVFLVEHFKGKANELQVRAT